LSNGHAHAGDCRNTIVRLSNYFPVINRDFC